MRKETIYYIKCKECGKEKKLKEEPNSWEEDSYYCKKCIAELKEPKKDDYDYLEDFLNKLERWKSITGKTPKYDLWGEQFYNDIYKYTGADKIKEVQREEIKNLIRESCHNESSSYYLEKFGNLVDLINM